MLDHAADLTIGVLPAGVLYAVRGDDEDGLAGAVLFPRVLVHIFNMVHRAADGVQQRRAAAHEVLLIRHGFDLLQIHAVVDHLAAVVEQHRGQQRLPRLLLLLFQHGVEAADGVVLQPRHGAAAIQDKYDFREIVVHKKSLLLDLLGSS